MRSSAFVPGASCDFGVKKTLLSYCSRTEMDGTTRICWAAESDKPKKFVKTKATAHRVNFHILKTWLWHNNDITSLKEEVTLRIFALNDILIRHGDLNLLWLPLTVGHNTKNMDFVS
ncbi:hypothetical protein NSPZN2_20054 [Nitrospira defluvii]|uniref:Uncharacterized protein n=1 Tax=Nitrospira defluvii TaxID=330214 RepID=A0ABM8RDE5_9BACT|nr:hypothetical protein NSPZN2_20054 [Nitrospira defluvii]